MNAVTPSAAMWFSKTRRTRVNRAAMIEEHLGRAGEALTHTDEAFRIAVEHGHLHLSEQIETFRVYLRRQIG